VGAFGEKLRKQREQRGIALDAISNTTKISTRLLRALEDEHFDQLPGGVFNKGFVRAYARQVGLDEEEAIADYLTALRESQIQQQSILPDFRAPAGKLTEVAAPERRPQNDRDNGVARIDLPNPDPRPGVRKADLPSNGGRNDRKPRRSDRRKQGRRDNDRRDDDRRDDDRRGSDLPSVPDSTTHDHDASPARSANHTAAQVPWGKLAVALLAVALVLAFWNSRRHAEPASAPRSVAASNLSPAPVPAPASAPKSSATQPHAAVPVKTGSPKTDSLKVGPAAPVGTLSSGQLAAATISTGATLSSSTPPPSLALAAPSPASSTTASLPASKPPAKPNVAATAPSPPPPPPTFTLLVRADENTWISILADGKTVAEENLIAPAHTSVRATREIVVKAGNAAGVSFLLNGKDIPAQGNEGEVKTYVFDPTGVRLSQPSPTPVTNR